ncbi:hypothetical protein [Rubinisphaera brasiliensis]|uniref:Uncharacterized protein n=1 Tax=Rubinisphaera brasiliensis (strain ATCC 49424 / DSM 5305 / JCM 21570 / IAM 15109 / NBRC 103401 / IFAM 1448) TaxID=756272 RepID=F0SQQ3_RUBBR|nr:hypothetical protein [Rubinisphaera brasiliensis]ADY59083.1 hypothetical protein Plabr_1472 [Rubinisphaera brasiliensis DSM 5305]
MAKFTHDTARRIADATRRTEKTPLNKLGDKRGRPQHVEILEGLLTEDLDAAGDDGNEATTAEMLVHKGKGDDWSERGTITVTNRSTTYSASAGDYVVVTRINGEWRPLTPSGDGGSNIVEGYLTSDLGSSSGASATLALYEYDISNGWSATGESVTVVQRGGFPANSGAYCVAFKVFEPQFVGTDTYRPIVLGCA